MYYTNGLQRSGGCSIMLLLIALNATLYSQNNAPALDSAVLKTVVIQATRASAQSPVPHTNISADQLEKYYQAQDIPFLLTGIPSLVESSDAGTGIGYTGMRIRGSDPTRINVTLNGIPLNDAESQGLFWVDLPDLASSLAEIQVQRGVGSSTNGAGAFGATVNLDLSQFNAEPFVTVTNTAGSFATRKHAVQLGSGLIGNKLVFTGRLSQIASDGFVDRASADLRSYHLSGTYISERQSVQLHLLSGHEITYQAWNGLPAQYLDNPGLRTFNTAGTERPGAPYPDEVDNYTQRHYLLHYKRLLSNTLDLQLNGHYTRGFGFFEQYKAGQRFEDYGFSAPVIRDSVLEQTDLVRRRWLDNHFYGGTFALRWAPAFNPPVFRAAPVLLLGGAYNIYEGQHFGEVIWSDFGFPKDARYYDNDATKRDGTIFGKFELHFRNGLSPFIDLQYRQVQYSFLGFDPDQNQVDQTATLHFFNPKLGLNWAFHPNTTAYAFFGIAHREPNRDDYTQSTPASRPLPEKLYDWEAGVKWSTAQWFAAANFFYMYYKNQLVLDGRINDVGAYIRTNVPESYRAGLELEGAWQPVHAWRFTGNVAFSRNKIPEFVEYRDNWDTGGQDRIVHTNTNLAFSPGLIARAEIQWNILPAGKNQQLALALSGKYVGEQYLDNTSNTSTRLPAFFFSDLRLNYDLKGLIGKEVSLILAVNNIWDAQYETNGWVYRYTSTQYDERPDNPYARLEGAGTYHQAGFFPQAGRQVYGTVRILF